MALITNFTGTIPAEIGKIDQLATNGLSGVHNSLAYRVGEIERHFHANEYWFGLAATPSGETHRADLMSGTVLPFSVVSGNSAFGNWVQVLGSSDTPVIAGNVHFDAHRFLITDTDSTSTFIFQIVIGESADLAAKVAAKLFTMAPYISASNVNDSGISEMKSIRIDAGDKVWLRVACVGQNTKTIKVYFGLHEYEG